MKASIVLVGLLCSIALFAVLSSADSAGTSQSANPAVHALPTSLDNFYPPNSPAPAYLLAMLDLATSFSGIVCDVLENDMANAHSTLKAFEKAYLETSDMIPEWKQEYPRQPVEALAAALETGDPSKIMPAVDEVGKVCHHCHLTFMAPVQQRYRWGSFADLSLTDPLTGEDVSFANLMLMMDVNFAGIAVDLEQGQPENAMSQLAGFNARFEAMADACSACHDSERRYFVDSSVTRQISQLEAELAGEKISSRAVGDILTSIGQESCAKCHLVHVPAAYAQQAFSSSKR